MKLVIYLFHLALWAAIAAASEDTNLNFALPFDQGEFEISHLPPSGQTFAFAEINISSIDGFADAIFNLPTFDGERQVGIDGLFLEYSGDQMDGLRIYAKQLGVTTSTPNYTEIIVDKLLMGSQPGSQAHQATGSIHASGAFASAKSVIVSIHNDFNGTHTESSQLRGYVSNLRFADILTTQLWPEFFDEWVREANLSSELSFLVNTAHQETEYVITLTIQMNDQPTLRLNARLTMHGDDPFLRRIDAIIGVDGFEQGDTDIGSSDPALSRQLAAKFGDRLNLVSPRAVWLQALAAAAHQFAQQGSRSEVRYELTIPSQPLAEQPESNPIMTLIDHLITQSYKK